MKAWETDKADVVRFVLRRSEWSLLIEALAGAAAWATEDRRRKVWDALDVLRAAEVDMDTTPLLKALTTIAALSKGREGGNASIINDIASRALASVETAKESEAA